MSRRWSAGQSSCEAPPLDQLVVPTWRHCQTQRPSASAAQRRSPLSVAVVVATLEGRLVCPAQLASAMTARMATIVAHSVRGDPLPVIVRDPILAVRSDEPVRRGPGGAVA
jgi:hypothetical protein